MPVSWRGASVCKGSGTRSARANLRRPGGGEGSWVTGPRRPKGSEGLRGPYARRGGRGPPGPSPASTGGVGRSERPAAARPVGPRRTRCPAQVVRGYVGPAPRELSEGRPGHGGRRPPTTRAGRRARQAGRRAGGPGRPLLVTRRLTSSVNSPPARPPVQPAPRPWPAGSRRTVSAQARATAQIRSCTT